MIFSLSSPRFLVYSRQLVLLSRGGSLLAQAPILMGIPISEPTQADWNSDGISDIVITTNEGLVLRLICYILTNGFQISGADMLLI